MKNSFRDGDKRELCLEKGKRESGWSVMLMLVIIEMY